MWTREDLGWLATNYPTLRETKSGQIEGSLTFKMLRTNGQYMVNPPDKQVLDTSQPDHLYINDTYDVRITWPVGEPYPKAHEIGGKLAKTAKRLNKNLLDMHQYEQDGALCLAATMDLERTFRTDFRLDIFIEEFLIPYLSAQTHYADTGGWLWGELSHGYLGLLEWLGRQDQPTDDDIRATFKYLEGQLGEEGAGRLLAQRWRGHFRCLCGSNKRTSDCHPEDQRAISLLRQAISRGLTLVPK